MVEVSQVNWFDVVYNYSVLGASILLIYFIVKIVKRKKANKNNHY